ncbi:MAG: peptidoglycan-binding protein [Scytonema sp. CRU_2_7]|nr:peptidoglycan-binding protein [Scytonema sp. CRU_2_7]
MSTQTYPTLQKGSKGESVKHLQDLLNRADRQKNFGNPPPLNVDGDFGSNTDTAVRNFQKFYGLSIDGIAGPKTWEKLEQVVG